MLVGLFKRVTDLPRSYPMSRSRNAVERKNHIKSFCKTVAKAGYKRHVGTIKGKGMFWFFDIM